MKHQDLWHTLILFIWSDKLNVLMLFGYTVQKLLCEKKCVLLTRLWANKDLGPCGQVQ